MTVAPKPHAYLHQLESYHIGAKPPQKYRLRLSHNEGPFGPSPKALAAYAAAAADAHRYPDYTYHALRQAIAAHFGLQADRVVCGNGSDDLITLLPRIYAGVGDDIMFSRYGFSVYPLTPHMVGAHGIAVPEDDMRQTIDRLISHLTPKTKLVFMANPNNPTGQMFTRDDVLRLHAALPQGALLVYDAAYADFVTDNRYTDGFDLARQFNNVVVLRTFSKIHALGGLRIGFAYAQPDIIDAINRVRNPFNVSAAAEAAAMASMLDKVHLEKSRNHNAEWREWMLGKLRGRNDVKAYDSQGNFILIDFFAPEKAKGMYEHLLSCGIQIRPMTSYQLPNHLRLTIGRAEDVQELWEAMEYYLKQHA
ncbi:MAG: histidinol-phosphate transaminase [Alphaproteobacteria bacterium]|nr:histidinol-phosphate transaminase [Alphaproteobacteria bacterium]NDC55725.1 histidinol-phosphate transaminase [Alphaproteobacteria bacterium]NDG04275.1 histidinol-phosphate transaminase [Alphaproteobacteria bacterium]